MTTSESRPAHLRPGLLAVVLVGGTLGTAAREGLSLAFPATGGVAWVIVGINVLGAFLLGLLLEALARSGPDAGRRRLLRLGLGTGVLGGFTTYSTFAVATAGLLGAGRPLLALAYVAATLLLGAAASLAGIMAGAALTRRRDER